jgi:hypothetical protein
MLGIGAVAYINLDSVIRGKQESTAVNLSLSLSQTCIQRSALRPREKIITSYLRWA